MLAALSRQLGRRTWASAGASGLAPPLGGAPALLHAAAPLLASLQVKIPALGESITDGTVAAVLKQTGDRVEEDEAILQIETDKVTVDVRAPQAGVIEAILVKPDDNVEVGHVVASIGDSAGAAQPAAAPAAAAEAPAAPPPAAKPKRGKAAAAAAAPAAPAPAAAAPAAAPAAHRAPSIAFPPRRTAGGDLISALPPSEARAALAQLLGAPESPGAPPVPPEYRDMIAVPIVGGSMPILRGPPVPAGPPGPPRRLMSEREMEAIMLGGAEP